MTPELIKVKPIPDHFHQDNQVVCERCMSQLVSAGNPHIDSFNEFMYVTGQLVAISLKGICSLVLVISKRARPFLEAIREHIYIANEVLLIVAKFLLFVSIGIGMLVAALFPTIVGRKTAHEEDLDNKYRAKKQKEWERLQQDKKEQQEFDDERDALFRNHHEKLRAMKAGYARWSDAQDAAWKKKLEEKYERDAEEMKKYNKNVQETKTAELSRPMLLHTSEQAEDDYLVRTANQLALGVERAVEDPEKARKAAEELVKEREELARKDMRRVDLIDRYKHKAWEAERLRREADIERRSGNDEEAERKERLEIQTQAEADGYRKELLSV